jgi:hypothetical protein
VGTKKLEIKEKRRGKEEERNKERKKSYTLN